MIPTAEGAALDEELDLLLDPQVPIPEGVRELTGITTKDVDGQPSFADRIDRIAPLLEDADLAGYNAIAYDVPLLRAEFERLERSFPGPSDQIVVDPYRLEQVLRPRTLAAVYERYTETPLEDAHDALSDVRATGLVLQHQLAEHDIQATPAELADLTRGDYLDEARKLKRDGDRIVVCFGKHEGKTLRELKTDHPDYFDWMYRTIDDLRPHIDSVFE